MTRPLPVKFRSCSRPGQLSRLAGPKLPASANLSAGGDFRCLHCQGYVSSDPLLAGVRNRNHCPYCLWSRHLDWQQAGDRLSVCRAAMKPIGLSLKRSRNRYAGEQAGELMLIHCCQDCGKIALNRIAADDDAGSLLKVFIHSLRLEATRLERLAASGIRLLQAQDRPLVYTRLQEVA